MAYETYPLHDPPEYDEAISAIQDSERVHASTVVNPRLEAIVNNIHYVLEALTAHTSDATNPHGVTPAQIKAVPEERKVNGHALTDDITLTREDIGIEVDLSGLEGKVEEALEQADNASDAAGRAQETADSALSTANTAKTAAETAQSTADTARSEASAAQTTANTAATTANAAMPKSGGSFTGQVIAQDSADASKRVRNIQFGTTAPTTLANGVVFLVYE